MLWLILVVTATMLYGFNVKERKLEDVTSTLFGVMYVIFFSYHIVLIDQKLGENVIWLVFITAFGTDIMAYFTGIAFGKHKLCPNLSPKKSIEGAVGGAIGSIIFCGIYGYFVLPSMVVECLVIGLIGSIFAQIGDLSASSFKRRMGIKDYGNLIPGHGGILDRFDSVLFTAPLVYYVVTISILVKTL
jgi:phosphatidate cytidylyltransferase